MEAIKYASACVKKQRAPHTHSAWRYTDYLYMFGMLLEAVGQRIEHFALLPGPLCETLLDTFKLYTGTIVILMVVLIALNSGQYFHKTHFHIMFLATH